MATCDELVVAVAGRYTLGKRVDRGRILDEFVAVTGHPASMRCACCVPGGRIIECGPRPDHWTPFPLQEFDTEDDRAFANG